MRYQWGPLLRDGGERRLNVADAEVAKLREAYDQAVASNPRPEPEQPAEPEPPEPPEPQFSGYAGRLPWEA
jgi:hypothetical protein